MSDFQRALLGMVSFAFIALGSMTDEAAFYMGAMFGFICGIAAGIEALIDSRRGGA